MDFAILPPEVTSGRMYAGPGSGTMLAAAAAWHTLAAELHSTANSYRSVVTTLTAGPWLGPTAASMGAAAAPYAVWMSLTAEQAEHTAAQAQAAAAAYHTAFAATVPPAVIAANRSLLMALVATNLFGQNTPAIAITETQYAEMWAQDATVMYGYASASAAATTLTPFSAPPPSASPGAAATQAAAVSRATGTSASKVQGTMSSTQQAFSAVPNALSSLAFADPPATLTPLDLLDAVGSLSGIFVDPSLGVVGGSLGTVALPYDVAGALTGFHTDDIISGWAGLQSWPGTAPVPPSPFPVVTSAGPGLSPVPSVSAGLGQAHAVGTLSVPPTWTAATPAVRPVALALPTTSASAAGAVMEVSSESTLSEMALAGMAGRAMASTLGSGGGRERGKALTAERAVATAEKHSAAGEVASQTSPRIAVTGIAAEIRELAKLRDEGILTADEFTEQKNRLLGR